MAALVFRPVTRRAKLDFVALFDPPGWQKQCWCMVWRATKEEGSGTSGAVRRKHVLGRIDRGAPGRTLRVRPWRTGSVGLDRSEKHLSRPARRTRPAASERIWSLACMFVRRDDRGRGLAHALIAAAVEHAKKRGATAVEAYPVDPDSPSYGYMGLCRRSGALDSSRSARPAHAGT